MKTIEAHVLSPKSFSGSVNGDYGYEINGEKSKNSYGSKHGARQAMLRAVDKILAQENK